VSESSKDGTLAVTLPCLRRDGELSIIGRSPTSVAGLRHQKYAIYLLDAQGRVSRSITGAQRLKGYSADEIIGQHFSRFCAPGDLATERAGSNVSRRLEEEITSFCLAPAAPARGNWEVSRRRNTSSVSPQVPA